jgi:hypothetical protein
MSSEQTNYPTTIEFAPATSIPDYLTGEIQSKLAYVDERIVRAQVSSDNILLEVSPWDEKQSAAELEAKVQRVVLSMARGAFKPKLQILEDHLTPGILTDLMPGCPGRKSPRGLIDLYPGTGC